MTYSKNKRQIGDIFEKIVLKKLGKGFYKTAGSGSVWKDGDIKHSSLVIECKVKNTSSSFSITKKEMDHLLKQADLQGKDWLFIEKNSDGRILVLLELDTFLETAEKWLNDKRT